MRVFKNVWFEKFARKEQLTNTMLCDAVLRAERGLIDAELGGGVIKQRIARAGGGRSGGYRALVFFRSGVRAIFAFGFATSTMANIDADDLLDLKMTARLFLARSEAEIDVLVDQKELFEMNCDA
jgi:hypothetical protein